MTIARLGLAAAAGFFLIGGGSASADGYELRGRPHIEFRGGAASYRGPSSYHPYEHHGSYRSYQRYGVRAVHYGSRFYRESFYGHRHHRRFYGGYSTGVDVGFSVTPPRYAPAYYEPPVQYAVPRVQYFAPQPQVIYVEPSYVLAPRVHHCGCE
jgi:hypothetical protein